MAKTLKRYRDLASKQGGAGDPLQYAFTRLKTLKQQGKHDAALKLALDLIPYGHGKIAPVDGDTGETAQSVIFQLD